MKITNEHTLFLTLAQAQTLAIKRLMLSSWLKHWNHLNRSRIAIHAKWLKIVCSSRCSCCCCCCCCSILRSFWSYANLFSAQPYALHLSISESSMRPQYSIAIGLNAHFLWHFSWSLNWNDLHEKSLHCLLKYLNSGHQKINNGKIVDVKRRKVRAGLKMERKK